MLIESKVLFFIRGVKICIDYFYDYKDLSIVKELYSAMPEVSKEHSLAKEIYELAFQVEEHLSSPIEIELPDLKDELFLSGNLHDNSISESQIIKIIKKHESLLKNLTDEHIKKIDYFSKH